MMDNTQEYARMKLMQGDIIDRDGNVVRSIGPVLRVGRRRIPLRCMGVREVIERIERTTELAEFRATYEEVSPQVQTLASLHETGPNRKERRAAEAKARRGSARPAPASSLSHPRYPEPDVTSVVREMFVEAEVEIEERRARHLERLMRSRQLTMDWMRVQALQGRIIDTATPEERIARDAAVAEECALLDAAEARRQA